MFLFLVWQLMLMMYLHIQFTVVFEIIMAFVLSCP